MPQLQRLRSLTKIIKIKLKCLKTPSNLNPYGRGTHKYTKMAKL